MKIRTRHPAGPAKSYLQKAVHWCHRNPLVAELLFPVTFMVALVILELLL